MGIKQFFNDAVTLGLAVIGQIDMAAREDLRTNFSGKKEYREGVAHSSFLERARAGREQQGTKIGRFLAEFNSKAGKRIGPADALVTNPNVQQKTFSERVRAGLDAVKNPQPKS